jgi:hypothetical protein
VRRPNQIGHPDDRMYPGLELRGRDRVNHRSRGMSAFHTAAGETERLFYGYSVLNFLPTGTVAKPSAETGTVMRRSSTTSGASTGSARSPMVWALSSSNGPPGERIGKKSARPLGPHVSEGRGLARSGVPAIIRGPEGNSANCEPEPPRCSPRRLRCPRPLGWPTPAR